MTRSSINLGGVTLSLHQLSDTGKPKLLCVHGGPGLDHKSLKGVEVLEDLFDIILVDLRGHGKSTASKDADYTLEAYSNDIFKLAIKIKTKDGLGILGHSFGGLVTVHAMARHEGIFDFGILCSSPLDASYQDTLGDAVKKHITDMSPEEIEKKFSENPNENISYARLMLDYGPMYFPNTSREDILKIMATWTFKVAPYSYAESSIFPDFDLKPLCPLIRVPMLAVVGSNDDIVPHSHIKNFEKYLKRCTVEEISGGHFPFTTHGQEFLSTISHWWDTNRKEIKS